MQSLVSCRESNSAGVLDRSPLCLIPHSGIGLLSVFQRIYFGVWRKIFRERLQFQELQHYRLARFWHMILKRNDVSPLIHPSATREQQLPERINSQWDESPEAAEGCRPMGRGDRDVAPRTTSVKTSWQSKLSRLSHCVLEGCRPLTGVLSCRSYHFANRSYARRLWASSCLDFPCSQINDTKAPQAKTVQGGLATHSEGIPASGHSCYY